MRTLILTGAAAIALIAAPALAQNTGASLGASGAAGVQTPTGSTTVNGAAGSTVNTQTPGAYSPANPGGPLNSAAGAATGARTPTSGLAPDSSSASSKDKDKDKDKDGSTTRKRTPSTTGSTSDTTSTGSSTSQTSGAIGAGVGK